MVDEAGMVGTRTLAQLLRHATTADATVILVGDPSQLPEIHAGGAFARLAARRDAVRLTENRRQHDPIERQAVAALRGGNIDQAVDLLDAHGRVHRSRTIDELFVAMTRQWQRATAQGRDALMVAPRRWQVDALNAATRAHLQRLRKLPADRLTVDGVGYSTGDLVVCLRNDPQLGVTNGTRGEITKIHHDGTMSINVVGRRRSVRVDRAYIAQDHLAHGYATTIHKAQGATVDDLLVLVTDDLGHQAGYTALTRGRHTNTIFTVADRHDRTRARERLTEALERNQRKNLARDHPGLSL